MEDSDDTVDCMLERAKAANRRNSTSKKKKEKSKKPKSSKNLVDDAIDAVDGMLERAKAVHRRSSKSLEEDGGTRTKVKRTKSSSKPKSSKDLGDKTRTKPKRSKSSGSVGAEKKSRSKSKDRSTDGKKSRSRSKSKDRKSKDDEEPKKLKRGKRPSVLKKEKTCNANDDDGIPKDIAPTKVPDSPISTPNTTPPESPGATERRNSERSDWMRSSQAEIVPTRDDDEDGDIDDVHLNDSSINDNLPNDGPPQRPIRQKSKDPINIFDSDDEDDDERLEREAKEREAELVLKQASQFKIEERKKEIEQNAAKKQELLAKKLKQQEYEERKENAKFQHAATTYAIEMEKYTKQEGERLEQIVQQKKQSDLEAQEALKAQEVAKDMEAYKEKEAMATAKARIEARKQELLQQQSERARSKEEQDDDAKMMAEWEAQETERLNEWAEYNAAQGDQLAQIAQNQKRSEKMAEEALKAQEMAEETEEFKQKQAMARAQERIAARKKEIDAAVARRLSKPKKMDEMTESQHAFNEWSKEEDEKIEQMNRYVGQEQDILARIIQRKEANEKRLSDALAEQERAKEMQELQDKLRQDAAKKRLSDKMSKLKGGNRDDTGKTQTLMEEELELDRLTLEAN